jgi:hypothetical protein
MICDRLLPARRNGVTTLIGIVACLALMTTARAQSPAVPGPAPSPASNPTSAAKASALAGAPLATLLEANVKTEWEAFKNKDKTAYSSLLADDFAAVEDDSQGMRNRDAAAAEVDRSVVTRYFIFALHVLPLDANAALVTYELTMQFPPTAAVRFKRVLVSELWLKRDKEWKMRYYQETKVR